MSTTTLRTPFLDLQAQFRELEQPLTDATLEIMRTGAFVMGKFNKALEEAIAQRHGVKHAIAVNSGTDALRILLQASGIGPGDEVITTAFTFVATIEVILQVGAKPVFVDIDLTTFNIDANLIEAAITPKTKAIMPVHLFGQMAMMEDIMSIASKHGLMVIEDAAQVVDTKRNGVGAGAYDRGCGLSFYVTKNLGAPGDGGMILTNFDEINESSRSLRIHGMGKERYYYDSVGYASRLSEIAAATLFIKLERLSDWNLRREQIAEAYHRGMAGCGLTLPITLDGNEHTWHQYSVLTPRRDELQAFLKERGIDSAIYYPVPLHMHDPYKTLAVPGLEKTEQACREVLNLPIHQFLTDEQVEHVCASVREFATS